LKNASTLAPPAPMPRTDPAPRRYFAAWTDFWFTPADPIALCRLRFLSGLLFICWLLPLAGQVEAFFGLDGWFDRTAYVEANDPTIMPNGSFFGWSLLFLAGSNALLLKALYWGSLGIFLLLALGIWVRLSAVLSWVMVVSFLAPPAANYDADNLLALIAFYTFIGHLLLGQWSWNLSPLERILGPKNIGILSWFHNSQREPAPSYAANLSVRLLQVHFAIVVVASGLHKLQIGEWWSGWAFWFPLHAPFQTTEADIQAEVAAGTFHARYFLLSFIQYLVLAWQLGFPIFAWRRRWRPVLLGGALVGWLGCIFLYGLPVFGPVYLLGCLSFLSPQEWLSLQRFAGRWTSRPAGAPAARPRFQPRAR